MNLDAYKTHPLHGSIDRLKNILTPDGSTESLSEAQQDIIERIEYLVWCLENSDHRLMSTRQLNRINQFIESLIQRSGEFTQNTRFFEEQFNEISKEIGNPRSRKLGKSDTAKLYRDLESKLREIDDWIANRKTELSSTEHSLVKDIEQAAADGEEKAKRWFKVWVSRYRKLARSISVNIEAEKQTVAQEINKAKTNVTALEELYENKLKLEAPTEY